MALIANGVVRFSLNGTAAGEVTWANIWDVWMGGVADADRPARCQTYAGLLMEWWESNIALSLTDDIILTSVAWVDLDSADGSTGLVTDGPNTSPPYTGALAQIPSPVNSAMLVTKVGASQRGSRNGRMYLLGFPEVEAGNTTLGTSYAEVLQERLDTFLSQTTDPAEIPEEGINPCIVHTRNEGTPENPNIVYAGMSFITGLTLQTRLATQRRRLRR